MSAADGSVSGVQKIVDHGPDAQRYNIVILGDGYRAGEMAKYHADVQSFVDVFRPDRAVRRPLVRHQRPSHRRRLDRQRRRRSRRVRRRQRRLRRHRAHVFRCDVLQRQPDPAPAHVRQRQRAQRRARAGARGARGDGDRQFAAVRRLGRRGRDVLHRARRRRDRAARDGAYRVRLRRRVRVLRRLRQRRGRARRRTRGGEPIEPNVTRNTNPRRSSGRRCCRRRPTRCRRPPTPTAPSAIRRPNPRLPDYVGAYEGARYMHCGCYRPSYNCRMRVLGEPFCGACQKAIRDALAPYLPIAYQGLWWKSPAGSEVGWGMNIAHQADIIFATWFTYDASGKAWWLSMTAPLVSGGNTLLGNAVRDDGPAVQRRRRSIRRSSCRPPSAPARSRSAMPTTARSPIRSTA